MLLIDAFDLTRFIGVYITQLSIGIIFFILSIRILRRNKTLLSSLLSTFFLLQALSFFLIAFLFPIKIDPYSYLMYMTSLYINLFSPIFLVFFLVKMIHFTAVKFRPKDYVIIILFALASFLLLSVPNGITYNEATGWRPKYSITFSLLFACFFTVILFIPSVFYASKIYKTFKDEALKKKYKYFIVGIVCYAIAFYGVIFFNTFGNTLFDLVWIIISLFLIPLELLVFYAIGANL